MLVVIGMAITFLLNLSERGSDEIEEQDPLLPEPVLPPGQAANRAAKEADLA